MDGQGSSEIIRLLVKANATLIPEDIESPLEYVAKHADSSAGLECIKLLCALGGRQPQASFDPNSTYAPWLALSCNFTPLMCLVHLSPGLARALIVEDGYSFVAHARHIPPRDDLGEPPALLDQIRQRHVVPANEFLRAPVRTVRLLTSHYIRVKWRAIVAARGFLVWLLRVSSESACAPGGASRKRDLEEYERFSEEFAAEQQHQL